MPYQYVENRSPPKSLIACATPARRPPTARRLDSARHRAPRQRALRPHPEERPLAAAPAPVQGQGRPRGSSKVHVVPMPAVCGPSWSTTWPWRRRFLSRSTAHQDIVKAVANRAGITKGREPARAAAHIRHDGLAEGDKPADDAEDPGPRQDLPDHGDLPQLFRRAHPGRVRAEVVRIGSFPGCPGN